MPTACLRPGRSPRKIRERPHANTGDSDTRTAEAATLVRRSEVIHDAKWRASATPATTAIRRWPPARRDHSRRPPDAANAGARTREAKVSRHAAMASGGAPERRISGAAHDIATTATSITRSGSVRARTEGNIGGGARRASSPGGLYIRADAALSDRLPRRPGGHHAARGAERQHPRGPEARHRCGPRPGRAGSTRRPSAGAPDGERPLPPGGLLGDALRRAPDPRRRAPGTRSRSPGRSSGPTWRGRWPPWTRRTCLSRSGATSACWRGSWRSGPTPCAGRWTPAWRCRGRRMPAGGRCGPRATPHARTLRATWRCPSRCRTSH